MPETKRVKAIYNFIFVAEQGKPGELYEKNGIYARMVDLQSDSSKWEIK